MRNIKTAYCVCLTLLGTSVGFAAPAALGTDGDVAWRRVHYGDLDLTRDQGAATLYARIRGAAQAVCTPQYAWAEKWVDHAARCRFQAVARAVADVNAPLLTSYYEAKTRSR